MKVKCPICGRKIILEDKRWLRPHTPKRVTVPDEPNGPCQGSGKVVVK